MGEGGTGAGSFCWFADKGAGSGEGAFGDTTGDSGFSSTGESSLTGGVTTGRTADTDRRDAPTVRAVGVRVTSPGDPDLSWSSGVAVLLTGVCLAANPELERTRDTLVGRDDLADDGPGVGADSTGLT